MKYCGYWTWAIHSVVSINDCQWHEISSIQIQNTEEKHCSVGHIQYIKMSSEETYSPFDSWCAHICHLQKTRLQRNVSDWDFFLMHLSSKWLHINRWRTFFLVWFLNIYLSFGCIWAFEWFHMAKWRTNRATVMCWKTEDVIYIAEMHMFPNMVPQNTSWVFFWMHLRFF